MVLSTSERVADISATGGWNMHASIYMNLKHDSALGIHDLLENVGIDHRNEFQGVALRDEAQHEREPAGESLGPSSLHCRAHHCNAAVSTEWDDVGRLRDPIVRIVKVQGFDVTVGNV
ncbi:hypothetical protein DCE93_02865 [Agromyces badenianii]|uniref:Uncharacterized protein n=1 Tax=Agromyces badenianii TaxID=2080742 RepID=A0A2S0WTV8_9MICO|nr:hypothetical protein DCE93_02865 [Agromyces badenianii]